MAPRLDYCKKRAEARRIMDQRHSIGLALQPARPQEAPFVLFYSGQFDPQCWLSLSGSKSRLHQAHEVTSEWPALWSTELSSAELSDRLLLSLIFV